MTFKLVDSKTGEGKQFEDLGAARAALREWVSKQRDAGEPVMEHAEGQWSDSRITIWIADADGQIQKLGD